MTNVKLTRTFYPVGQGAFYGETFEFQDNWMPKKINVVYDCGSSSNSKEIDYIFKEYRPGTIDILFISHFDSDHVNKIHNLQQYNKIKRVVIPLVEDKHKKFLIAFNSQAKKFIAGNEDNIVGNLLQNPNIFFGDETTITYVRDSQTNEPPNEDDNIIAIEELPKGEIPSGKKIGIYHNSTQNKIPLWIYSPYNYRHADRSKIITDTTKKSLEALRACLRSPE